MSTKKKSSNAPSHSDLESAAYEATIKEFDSAVRQLQNRDFASAKIELEKIQGDLVNEPELGDRVATYLRICERKLASDAPEPAGTEEHYRRAVFLLNAGDQDRALQLLNRALAENPTSVDLLYVRACAWAKQGAPEKAVGDLRQAIAADPKIRFQAINDTDFERIREEPAFIDIIEPTPTGA